MLSRFETYLQPSEQVKINQYLEKAKSVDLGTPNYNLELAIEYFEKAAKGHISYAERRLGALYAGKDFNKAVGYYTMAVEDGDTEYSYKMAEALTCAYDDDETHMNKPHKLALRVHNGEYALGSSLMLYYYQKLRNPTRAIESAYACAKKGDTLSLYFIAFLLCVLDGEQSKRTPGHNFIFHQPQKWVNIAKKVIGHKFRNWEIFSIPLFVHSVEDIEDAFSVMTELLEKHSSERYLNEGSYADKVAEMYLNIVQNTRDCL